MSTFARSWIVFAPTFSGHDVGHAAESTLLHRVVRDNLEEFLEHARDTYTKPIPTYVERALRGYLKCGRCCLIGNALSSKRSPE